MASGVESTFSAVAFGLLWAIFGCSFGGIGRVFGASTSS